MLTTEAEDAVGHIHDRMPLMVEPRPVGRVARPAPRRRDDLLELLVPAAPGRLEAYPVSTLVSNVRNNGPELLEPLPLGGRRVSAREPPSAVIDDPARRGPAGHASRARQPVATLLLSHGAGGGIDTRDLEALARDLPRNGVTVVLLEQPWRVAGRKVATAAGDPRRGLTRGRRRAAGPHAAGGRRPLRRGPVGRPLRHARSAPPAAWRWPSRCTRPAGRRSRGSTSCAGAGVPTLVVQGERDAFGRPEEFPDDVDLGVVPGADHGFKVPARGAGQPGRGDGDRRRVDAGVDRARGRRGIGREWRVPR